MGLGAALRLLRANRQRRFLPTLYFVLFPEKFVKMGILEKIKEIELEMTRTQKNKATEYHLGQLKAKLAKLRTQLQVRASAIITHGPLSPHRVAGCQPACLFFS